MVSADSGHNMVRVGRTDCSDHATSICRPDKGQRGAKLAGERVGGGVVVGAGEGFGRFDAGGAKGFKPLPRAM